jgi:hypothetical protein
VYRGIAQFNSQGEAIVNLPDYFSDINTNPSYQLTPIGGPAQLYIKEKINHNQFIIGGGQSGMEVSWMVTAERNDLYLQKNPLQKSVEMEKEQTQKGKYFMPTLYGQPMEKYMFFRNMNLSKQESLNMLDKK